MTGPSPLGGSSVRPAVFVCGPITNVIEDGAFDGGVRARIEGVARRLEAEGFEVLSAHREEAWGARIPDDAGAVFRRDWFLARLADAMVFVLPTDAAGELVRTDGTFMELGWSVALGKPSFVLTPTRADCRSYLFDGFLDVAPDSACFDLDDPSSQDRLVEGLRRVLVDRGTPAAARGGPGLDPPRPAWEVEPGHLLVSLDGEAGVDVEPEVDGAWERAVLEALHEALRILDQRGRPAIRRVLVNGVRPAEHEASLDWRQLSFPVHRVALTPRRFQLELRRARWLATPPATGAIAEACALGVPCRLMLPRSVEQFRVATRCATLGLRHWPLPVTADAPSAAVRRALVAALDEHAELVDAWLELLAPDSPPADAPSVDGRRIAEQVARWTDGGVVEPLPRPLAADEASGGG